MAESKKPQKLIGGAERTGVYLSKDDFEELKRVITEGQTRDAIIKLKGGAQLGAGMQGGTALEAPTIGSMGIQDFVRKLVKNYGFNDSDRVLYGVNKHGEIMRWMTPDEVTDFRTKKGG